MDAVKTVSKLIKDNAVKFVDYRFTDFTGRVHHITFPIKQFEESVFKNGINFDGSSIAGWCEINHSDMFLMPDPASAHIDPFMNHPTLVLFCGINDPSTGDVYDRDPRGIAARAEAYLKKSGLGDTAYFGPELEFFVFDNVLYKSTAHESSYHIDVTTGAWNSGNVMEEGNTGHVPGIKGGYFALAPIDRTHEVRSEICNMLEQVGIEPQLHHHEVATGSQCEVGTKFGTPVRKADEVQLFKYIAHNVADLFGKTITFMPKPLNGDNGSGMHVHQSIWKGGKNLFAGGKYDHLSQEALWYIGGIIKHAKAINAFTNPSTNSYKRLIPGYEAPVILAYASRNRSAAIRIPATGKSTAAKRIEVRFPDPTANPYLGFAAMLMAGLDGIRNKIDPGKAQEDNLYDLPESKLSKLPQVCGSLREALECLSKDRKFLLEGGVFTDDMIDAYINLKMQEVIRLEHTPCPVEFEMYYSA